MTSLAEPVEHIDDGVHAAARALSGAAVVEVTAATGGSNNRVFSVLTETDRYALKQYPNADDDPRDRLGVEFSSLNFLKDHGVDQIPAAIASDANTGFALYEWIDGAAIKDPSGDDIDAVLGFAETLYGLAGTKEAQSLPAASEACLSADELARQVDARLRRLTAIADEYPELQGFLAERFSPIQETLTAKAKQTYDTRGADFSTDLEPAARTLNPSDFGFHNTLRNGDGRLVFLDFEYFGWDDPVKLVSDFLLHPGHVLSGDAGGKFLRGVRKIFTKDSDFEWRLDALYPLYGLRWCMIMLAEFLPERMARRRLAGQHKDPKGARKQQLSKAETHLNTLMATDGAIPYGD